MRLRLINTKNRRHSLIGTTVIMIAVVISVGIAYGSTSDVLSRNGIIRIIDYKKSQEEVKGIEIKKEISPLSFQKSSILKDSPTIGLKESADVVLIEILDFTDKYSQIYLNNTRPRIVDEFIKSGDLLIVTKHLPLVVNRDSTDISLALHCSFILDGEDRYNSLRNEILIDKSVPNIAFIEQCKTNQKVIFSINEHMNFAQENGIKSVPTFIIGRIDEDKIVDSKIINGSEDFNRFAKIIREKHNE